MRFSRLSDTMSPRLLVILLYAGLALLALAFVAPSPIPLGAAAPTTPTASLIALEDGTNITITGERFAPLTLIHLDFTSMDHATMQESRMAMDVSSDTDGRIAMQIAWQMVPPYGCYRNEMVTIEASTSDGVVASSAVCQPPVIPIA